MRAMTMASIGDNVVDRYLLDEMVYPGGGAANVAVHARRSGWIASYLGVIGTDSAGDLVANSLAKEGVHLNAIQRSEEPNATTDIRIDEHGNREFSSWVPPRTDIVLSTKAMAALSNAKWIYTNYASLTEHLVPELAKLAPVVFDFSYKDENYANDLLPDVQIAAFSRDGIDDDVAREMITRVQQRGPEIVIITRGNAGAIIGANGYVHFQSAASGTIVDTLGAGDAFLARFVCGFLSNESMEIAAAAAARTAAKTCGHYGAFGHGAPLVSKAKGTT